MSIIANLLQKFFGKSEFRVLMVGLDAAGRTTILYKMKLGEIVTTIPTIGTHVHTIAASVTGFNALQDHHLPFTLRVVCRFQCGDHSARQGKCNCMGRRFV
jgi:hypothetical protein